MQNFVSKIDAYKYHFPSLMKTVRTKTTSMLEVSSWFCTALWTKLRYGPLFHSPHPTPPRSKPPCYFNNSLNYELIARMDLWSLRVKCVLLVQWKNALKKWTFSVSFLIQFAVSCCNGYLAHGKKNLTNKVSEASVCPFWALKGVSALLEVSESAHITPLLAFRDFSSQFIYKHVLLLCS